MLIIEDGSQVTSSNSFVTDAEYTEYATLKGLSVAATTTGREQDLLAAIDYIKAQECNIQGCRVSSTQSMLFPRTGVWLYGWSINSDTIPNELKNAQMEAAAYNTDGNLLNNSSITNTKSEKLDGLQVEYFNGGKRSNVNLQRVNSQLSALMKDTDKLVRT